MQPTRRPSRWGNGIDGGTTVIARWLSGLYDVQSPISKAIEYNYPAQFGKWGTYGNINGLIPYLGKNGIDLDKEARFLSYIALSVGRLHKDMMTTVNHLK